MELKKRINGYVVCSFKEGELLRFLNMCKHHNWDAFDVSEKGDKVFFSMDLKTFFQCKAIMKKCNICPHIEKKRGMPFIYHKINRNRTFSLGIILFFLVLMISSSFVWKINIIGVNENEKTKLYEYVCEQGRYPGILRRNIKGNELENLIRSNQKRISWVSCEENGSVCNIYIKKGTGVKREKKKRCYDLTAPMDGTVTSIITSSGTPKVTKNTKVKKGDILIEGLIDKKNENDEVVKRDAVGADGCVWLEGEIMIERLYLDYYMKKEYQKKELHTYEIKIGNKSVYLKNPLKKFDKFSKYDIMNYVCNRNKNHIFNWNIQTNHCIYKPYVLTKTKYDSNTIVNQTKKDWKQILAKYRKKGDMILSSEAKVLPTFSKTDGKNYYRLQGKIRLRTKRCNKKKISTEEWSIENGTNTNDSSGA